jgi:hypothetical protein
MFLLDRLFASADAYGALWLAVIAALVLLVFFGPFVDYVKQVEAQQSRNRDQRINDRNVPVGGWPECNTEIDPCLDDELAELQFPSG